MESSGSAPRGDRSYARPVSCTLAIREPVGFYAVTGRLVAHWNRGRACDLCHLPETIEGIEGNDGVDQHAQEMRLLDRRESSSGKSARRIQELECEWDSDNTRD